MSNHFIHVKHVINVKSCHSCQIMSFMPNHVIHVKSCHSCQIMSFMSNHVIHVKSCHSSCHGSLVFSRNSLKLGGRGVKCLPRPLATALLLGRRQKYLAKNAKTTSRSTNCSSNFNTTSSMAPCHSRLPNSSEPFLSTSESTMIYVSAKHPVSEPKPSEARFPLSESAQRG
jgi:hypothetical protein